MQLTLSNIPEQEVNPTTMIPCSIREMIADSCIFLTGVSGFIGSAVVQRILSLDPGPELILVLMREKQGATARERLDKILSSVLFADIPREKLKRVRAVTGDIGEKELGISQEDQNLLISRCTYVFHSAAIISFATSLDRAIKINVSGSRSVLELAKKMVNCRAMVHISTAYANSHGTRPKYIEEKVYPFIVDPYEFLEMVERMSPKELERRTAELIGEYYNAYTLTKHLAEIILAKEKGDLPLCIVRPSLVLCSLRDPIPNWVNGINNLLDGLIVGVGRGIFRTFPSLPQLILDVIPLDLVVSTILAGTLATLKDPTDLHIFHSSSSTSNPTTWKIFGDCVQAACRKYPFEKALWYPKLKLRHTAWRHNLVFYIFQILPAHLICLTKFFRWQTGPTLLNFQRKYARVCILVKNGLSVQMLFGIEKSRRLYDLLPPQERAIHLLNPRIINWDDYFENYVIGLRRYCLHESEHTMHKNRSNINRLRIIAILSPYVSFALLWILLNLFGFPSVISSVVSCLIVLFLVWL